MECILIYLSGIWQIYIVLLVLIVAHEEINVL